MACCILRRYSNCRLKEAEQIESNALKREADTLEAAQKLRESKDLVEQRERNVQKR